MSAGGVEVGPEGVNGRHPGGAPVDLGEVGGSRGCRGSASQAEVVCEAINACAHLSNGVDPECVGPGGGQWERAVVFCALEKACGLVEAQHVVVWWVRKGSKKKREPRVLPLGIEPRTSRQ